MTSWKPYPKRGISSCVSRVRERKCRSGAADVIISDDDKYTGNNEGVRSAVKESSARCKRVGHLEPRLKISAGTTRKRVQSVECLSSSLKRALILNALVVATN